MNIQNEDNSGKNSNDSSGDSAAGDIISQADFHTFPSSTHTEAETVAQVAAYQKSLMRYSRMMRPWYGTCILKNHIKIRRNNSLPAIVPCGRWTGQRNSTIEELWLRLTVILSCLNLGWLSLTSRYFWTFQFHKSQWMENASSTCSNQLTREFYKSYASTLMNLSTDTETTKRGQKDLDITLGPLNSIIIQSKSIDILKNSINRMLHGPEYSTPPSVSIF